MFFWVRDQVAGPSVLNWIRRREASSATNMAPFCASECKLQGLLEGAVQLVGTAEHGARV
jgi:hypothetical protein